MEIIMKLKIYNTLTRTKEDFVPLMEKWKKDFVWIYSCGPTVYSDPHIWNLRATFVADLIRNVIRNILWYPVKDVMNITDVGHLVSDGDEWEDKMEKWAKQEWLSARDIAQKYENNFKNHMDQLNIDEFTYMPRATEHIQEQINLVKTLEDKGYTYIIEWDGVYMDTSKVEDYGKLMWPNFQKHLDGLKSGARIEDTGKKNMTDFALWKFASSWEKRQMEWDSPWGRGFPGWHAECSAMSSKYLGNQFDIHHGGVEHIPVHHSDEIAQSECAFWVNPWVKYWIHHQWLVAPKWEKFSKSLGNAFILPDLVEKGYDGLDLRYMYFTAHYRSFLEFTLDSLTAAQNTRKNLKKRVQSLLNNKDAIIEFDKTMSFEQLEKNIINSDVRDFLDDVVTDLCDDFNTPKVIAHVNTLLNNISHGKIDDKKECFVVLHWLEVNLLKLWLFDREEVDIPAEIKELADERWNAKLEKDWWTADNIRDELASKGWKMLDGKDSYELEQL